MRLGVRKTQKGYQFAFASATEEPSVLLRYKKGEEKKETIPLCLIDFETLEVYSMQDFYRGYFVRDYWVQLDFIDDKIELEAFYLPVRE